MQKYRSELEGFRLKMILSEEFLWRLDEMCPPTIDNLLYARLAINIIVLSDAQDLGSA